MTRLEAVQNLEKLESLPDERIAEVIAASKEFFGLDSEEQKKLDKFWDEVLSLVDRYRQNDRS